MVADASSGKLYIMGSHWANSEFWRLSYSIGLGTWTVDPGFPVEPAFLHVATNNPVNLVRAKNGELWIFRIQSNSLQAKRSSDNGATWSASPIS